MLYNKQRPCLLLLTILIYVTGSQKTRSQYSMKQHVCCKQGNVTCHSAQNEEVKQEVACVLRTDAVVDPDTVVVEPLNTPVADPTVFRASWFYKLARRTGNSRVKQPLVVWVDV